MNILILEDWQPRIDKFKERLMGHDVYFTDKPKEAIELLKVNNYDLLCLDHDMGGVFEAPGEGTGYEVALWIQQHPDRAPRKILLHTMNNVGASAMMLALGRADIRATYIPLLWEKINV